MKRRLFNFAVGVSLVLCLAACGMWVRSFFHADYIGVEDGQWHGVKLGSAHGSVALYVDPRMTRPWGPMWTMQTISAEGRRLWLGQFYFSRGYWGVIVLVPYWFVALGCLVVPAIAWRRVWLRRHRADRGLCIACGYDLHATPERCPECGFRRAQSSGVVAERARTAA